MSFRFAGRDLEQKETFVEISRKDALIESERIEFENPNIIGAISLKGAAIDDLTFKNYNVDLGKLVSNIRKLDKKIRNLEKISILDKKHNKRYKKH